MYILANYLAYLIVFLPMINSIPLDDECYKSSVESFNNIEIDENGNFYQVALKCLGKDANVEVNDFIQCVINYNKCNIDWYNLVDWKYCICDTFIANLRDCITEWLSKGHMGDFTCINKLFNECSTCLLKQKYNKTRIRINNVQRHS